jgi:hypothetical protein
MTTIPAEGSAALQFHELSKRVVDDVTPPRPVTKDYDITPVKGLYYRDSGRLLTPFTEDSLTRRVLSGLRRGVFFELQRIGSVEQEDSRLQTSRWHKPAHRIIERDNPCYAAMRWIDGEWLRETIPQYQQELDGTESPKSVIVLSWLGSTVVKRAQGSVNPFSHYDMRVRSIDDEVATLELFTEAEQAYKDIQSGTASAA